MRPQIQETATTSPIAIDYVKGLRTRQGEWTARSLGIELGEEALFTKKDFEEAAKKVGRKPEKRLR